MTRGSRTRARPTSSRAARAAETRARILESARRVLAEEGIERFTTRRVAELAGVSHGMVHYHFEDKRDLILALVVHARRDWVEPLEELVDGPGTAEARMRSVIAWMAEPATSETMRVHLSLYVSALRDEVVRRRLASEYARWRAPFATLFSQLGDELGIDLDAQSLGEAFATAADGLVQQQAFDPALPTDRILTSTFERLVWPDGAPRRRAPASRARARIDQSSRRKRR
jgi:AcrR family transcriptional regulator